MKAKTFENLIRKVVREEIDYALRREIKSLKEDLRDELKPTITEHKERLVEVPKNPMSETANSPVSLSDPFASGAPMPMDTTGMPESVANAVTRDYSGLMKAIDKKKGK